MKPEQHNVIETVVRHFNFTGLNDRNTYITRHQAAERIHALEKLKPSILKCIPKDYTIRIRNGLHSGKEVICALRQLIRFSNHRLVGKKKQTWNKVRKKTEAEWYYQII